MPLRVLGLILWVIAYNLMRLYYAIFPSKSSRRKNDVLQTPTVTLYNVKTKKRLVVLGMMHVADKEYFAGRLNQIKDFERQGYVVLYEGVGRADQEQIQQEPEEVRRAYEYMLKSLRFRDLVCALLGVVNQSAVLRPQMGWINTDVDLLSLIRRIEDAGGKQLWSAELDDLVAQLDKDEDAQEMTKVILDHMLVRLPYLSSVKLYNWLFGRKAHRQTQITLGALLGWRNQVAVEGILKYLDHDVVAVWGAGHIPGMLRLLRRHGYRLEGITWQDTYRKRTGPFFAAIAEMAKRRRDRLSREASDGEATSEA